MNLINTIIMKLIFSKSMKKTILKIKHDLNQEIPHHFQFVQIQD